MRKLRIDYKPTILLAIAVLFLIPPGVADEIGTPPTLQCELNLPRATGALSQPALTGADVDSSGNFFIIEYYSNNGFYAARILKFNPACNLIWGIVTDNGDDFGCAGQTGSNGCDIWGLAVDARGDIVVGLERIEAAATPQNQYYLCRLDGQTGSVDGCSQGFHEAEMAAAGVAQEQPASGQSLGAIRVSDTEVAYLMSQTTSGKLIRFDDDLVPVYAASISNSKELFADAQTGVAYVRRPTTSVYSRIDQETGAILHSSTLFETTDRGPPMRSSTNAWGIGGSTNIKYYQLNKDTFATVTASTDTTPSQFQVSAVSKTTIPFNHWADGADDLLSCGQVQDGGTSYAYAARIDTSMASIAWGTMFLTTGATSTLADEHGGCQLDYLDGFWTSGTTVVGGVGLTWIRHYTNSDFVQLAPPEPVSGGGIDAGPGNVIQNMNQFASDAWGFDFSWLITLGIVGICVAGFSRFGAVATIVSIVLGVGIAVALGVGEVWFLLLLVFVIVAFAGNRLFGGRSEGDE